MIIDTAAKQLLFSTMRIEGVSKDGSVTCGTAFMLTHEFPGYGTETFVVTNKHVVQGLEAAQLYFTRKLGNQPLIGNTFAYRCGAGFGSAFHGHPRPDIDIAVFPVSFMLTMAQKNADREPFMMPCSTQTIPAPAAIQELDAILPLLFVGYPNGLYDQKHMTPIVRTGTTATPVTLDYCGAPVFLMDASVFPGSSGSPVFTFRHTMDGGIADLRLLGIISSVFVQSDTGELCIRPAPTADKFLVEIKQMLDLGLVFKSHLIIETIVDCWKHQEAALRAYRRHSGR